MIEFTPRERLYKDGTGTKRNLRGMMKHEPEWVMSRFIKMESEIESIKNALDDHWRSEQQGHVYPCTYGPLCPWCEIDKLKNENRHGGVRDGRDS
jgi:hypothetical protein